MTDVWIELMNQDGMVALGIPSMRDCPHHNYALVSEHLLENQFSNRGTMLWYGSHYTHSERRIPYSQRFRRYDLTEAKFVWIQT